MKTETVTVYRSHGTFALTCVYAKKSAIS